MPRRNNFLFILPKKNLLDYGSCVLREVAESNSYGNRIIFLEGDDANPSRIRSVIESEDPILVVGVGHGSRCAYTVEDMLPFLMVRSPKDNCPFNLNLGICAGRVWVLNSCDVGEWLGREMVTRGAAAFIGEEDPFIFVIVDEPCASHDVKSVFYAEYKSVEYLMRGYSVAESFYARQDAYEDEIRYYLTGPGSTSRYADIIIRTLEVDKNIGVVYGDSMARVSSRLIPYYSPITRFGFGLVTTALSIAVVLGSILKRRK